MNIKYCPKCNNGDISFTFWCISDTSIITECYCNNCEIKYQLKFNFDEDEGVIYD